MGRNSNPEIGFRSRCSVLRLEKGHGPERLDGACRYALDLGTGTWRGLDSILRTGADLADDERQAEPVAHGNIRGPEYCK